MPKSALAKAQVVDMHECRVLAALALRPMSMDELMACSPLKDLERLELESAVANLIVAGRLGRRIVAVRYCERDRYLRRDVAVYFAVPKREGGRHG